MPFVLNVCVCVCAVLCNRIVYAHDLYKIEIKYKIDNMVNLEIGLRPCLRSILPIGLHPKIVEI